MNNHLFSSVCEKIVSLFLLFAACSYFGGLAKKTRENRAAKTSKRKKKKDFQPNCISIRIIIIFQLLFY